MVLYVSVLSRIALYGPVWSWGWGWKNAQGTEKHTIFMHAHTDRQEDVHIGMVPTLKTVPVRGRKDIPL